MTAPAIVFLMYHELALPGRSVLQSEPGYTRYVLELQEFEGQMLAMREAGLRGISVSEALKLPEGGVAITFDDGCETDLLAAAPILKKLGFGATFYVISGRIGQTGYLSVAQLRELDDSGFEIGCHSMTHGVLSDLDDAGVRYEVAEAKEVLERALGRPVEHFSCPGGRYDSRTMAVARQTGYRTVANSIPRANSSSSDPFSLGRVAITRGLSLSAFQKLCRGETLWKLGLRASMRDGAKRLLGTAAYDRVRATLLRR